MTHIQKHQNRHQNRRRRHRVTKFRHRLQLSSDRPPMPTEARNGEMIDQLQTLFLKRQIIGLLNYVNKLRTNRFS